MMSGSIGLQPPRQQFRGLLVGRSGHAFATESEDLRSGTKRIARKLRSVIAGIRNPLVGSQFVSHTPLPGIPSCGASFRQ